MLAELEKLPPLVQTLTAAKPVKRAPPGTKKKNRNLIKVFCVHCLHVFAISLVSGGFFVSSFYCFFSVSF